MVGHNFDALEEYVMRGYVNWNTVANTSYYSSNAIYVMCLSAYTPSHLHAVIADVLGAGTQSSGTGYTAGGQAVTLSNTYSKSGGAYPYLTDFKLGVNPSWTLTTGPFTVAYAVYYINATVNSIVKPVLTYQDMGGATTLYSGTYTITESGAVVIERKTN